MKIKKVYADALTTLAKGTDAGIYRLNPKRVEIVSCEQDVKRVLAECEKTGKSVTFKAGGTSLSGQTITDSVLMEISPDYGKVKISGDGSLAKFPCGITGEEANRWLKPYGRKLGPSPASIKSARIGGIVANNSSGSSYGIIHNSYNTVRDMEIIFADGAFLDTSSLASRRDFMQTHIGLLEKLMNFRLEILLNPDMEDRILSKYELKNTCGYGMIFFFEQTTAYDMNEQLTRSDIRTMARKAADYITFNCDGVSEGFEITLKGYTVFVDYTARLCNDELAEFAEVPAVWDQAGRECPEIAEALQLMLN